MRKWKRQVPAWLLSLCMMVMMTVAGVLFAEGGAGDTFMRPEATLVLAPGEEIIEDDPSALAELGQGIRPVAALGSAGISVGFLFVVGYGAELLTAAAKRK